MREKRPYELVTFLLGILLILVFCTFLTAGFYSYTMTLIKNRQKALNHRFETTENILRGEGNDH